MCDMSPFACFFVFHRYSDLGGISGILQEVRELIEYPLVHPEVYAHLGIEPVSCLRLVVVFMACVLIHSKRLSPVKEAIQR